MMGLSCGLVDEKGSLVSSSWMSVVGCEGFAEVGD